jgi:predicted enzyme related to lactoylglutathione lyase
MSGQGQFVWYDLNTTDRVAAASFYQAVVGWHTSETGSAGRIYTILHAGSAGVGGIWQVSAAELAMVGAQPAWIAYISVDDVDHTAARIEAARGHILHAPEDIPGIGRFAVTADPHGAAFIIFAPASNRTEASAPAGTPGHFGWNELHAGDLETEFTFYAGLFGWTKTSSMDMGGMRIYQMFSTGGADAGAMLTRGDSMRAPGWVFYINVDNINAAATRVSDAGGRIITGPLHVAAGSWILHGIDPQGAMFALLGPD